MAEIPVERVTNCDGLKWVRNHATGNEFDALCCGMTEADDQCEVGEGRITCVECISLINKCRSISDDDIAPENEDEVLNRKFRNHYGKR